MNDHLRKEPPDHGEIVFAINRSPVSLQSKADKKSKFKEFVKGIIKDAEFILTGDVKVIIEWHVTEQYRYEHSNARDIDNIIKPLLDSISGPAGILIDDNQVQSIECNWINIDRLEDEKVLVYIKYTPFSWLPKDGLVFLVFENGICLPFNENLSLKSQKVLVGYFIQAVDYRKRAKDYYSARQVMPVQRVFNKGRLNGFKITNLEDKMAVLQNS